MNEKEKVNELARSAAVGDRVALEELLTQVHELAFNLALRMLGMQHDAEDAAQEITLRVMTRLKDWRGESAFSTWVFRIACNFLLDYRKGMFAERPLSFEFYGADIANAQLEGLPDLTQGVDRALLAQELKLSCMNVMLQCMSAEERCIFILGTMFRVDSRIAAELFGLTPEAYRQRLSRVRRRMADFLSEYCQWSGTGCCRCEKRIDYAIQTHRLNPAALEYSSLSRSDENRLLACVEAMEELDGQSALYAEFYRAPQRAKEFLSSLLQSEAVAQVTG